MAKWVYMLEVEWIKKAENQRWWDGVKEASSVQGLNLQEAVSVQEIKQTDVMWYKIGDMLSMGLTKAYEASGESNKGLWSLTVDSCICYQCITHDS